MSSYVCPVCNGLRELSAVCSRCGGSIADDGRQSDYYGPYSPYQPLPDTAMTNGYADVSRHMCIHAGHCTNCGAFIHSWVQEQFM